MKDPKPRRTAKQKIRTPHEQLAREAAEWDERKRTPAGFRDAPEAIPRVARSVAISIRMPGDLLELLKRFAGREGVGQAGRAATATSGREGRQQRATPRPRARKPQMNCPRKKPRAGRGVHLRGRSARRIGATL